MSDKVKVDVFFGQDELAAACCEHGSAGDRERLMSRGLTCGGTVEIDRIGVNWGPKEEISDGIMQRVRDAVAAGKLTP